MADRNYIVSYKRGWVAVVVRQSTIDLRGEKEAVVQAAWFKLMGKNELGEDVDKNLATRDILMDEIFSRYEPERKNVYAHFADVVKIKWVGVVHG